MKIDQEKVPSICKKAVCITDNPIFAAVISSYFNREDEYFCVVEAPRMARPDVSNEIIRRTNLLARLQPDKVILADVGDNVVIGFLRNIPLERIIRIKSLDEIDPILKAVFGIEERKKLSCKSAQVSSALLIAKLTKKHLQIEEKAKEVDIQEVNSRIESEHVVVADDMRWVSPVIAANYAFSIGSKLIFFPETDKDDIEIIYDDIAYSRYYAKSARGKISTRSLVSQQYTYESYLPSGKIDASFATFITKGIPYGYFFPDIPTTHLFSYPDLGITILNSIHIIGNMQGTKSALLVDPGIFPKEWGETETGFVSNELSKRGIFVKELRGKEAMVYKTSLFLQWYPYDLLYICSHAGKMDGQKLRIKFLDRYGKEHEIVIEEAVSFELTDEGEGMDRMVEVMSFMRFVSIDGFDWRDKSEKSTVTKETIEDFLTIDRTDWQILEKEDIPYVRRSVKIGLADGDYQATFHALASGEVPIIFNNACVSFYEFAGKFFFAGARSYIGTLTNVDTHKAKQVAQEFFKNISDSKSLPVLLWETQKKVYDDPKNRVYVHVGTHFCNIASPSVDPIDYVKRGITTQVEHMNRKLARQNKADVQRNITKAVKFLSDLIDKK